MKTVINKEAHIEAFVKDKVKVAISLLATLSVNQHLPIMTDQRGNIEGTLTRDEQGILYFHCPWVIHQPKMALLGQTDEVDTLSAFILNATPELCKRMFLNNPVPLYAIGTVAPEVYIGNVNRVWVLDGDDVEARDVFQVFENGTETNTWIMAVRDKGPLLSRLISTLQGAIKSDSHCVRLTFNGKRASYLPFTKVKL